MCIRDSGATHQGIYDVAFFSNVNIPVFAPANYAELRYWLTYLVREARGPRTIRYARGDVYKRQIWHWAAACCRHWRACCGFSGRTTASNPS